MKPLAQMTRAELEEIVVRLETKARARPSDLARMTREALCRRAESLYVPPRQKRPRVKRPRSPRNLGIGRWCQALLAKIVGQGPHGPIGLSYEKMVAMARRKFPMSAVDERHLRWYAAKMRREDKFVPADRPRSNWL